jgi:phosphatidate cytidylyltransferase
MTKLIQRLLIFLIGLPLGLGIVLFLPQRNHLASNIGLIILSALGAVEFAGFLKKKHNAIGPLESAILGMSAPVAMTLVVSFGAVDHLIFLAFILGAFWLLVSRVFSSEDQLKDTINRVSAGFSVMFYPGIFIAWFIKMNQWPQAGPIVFMFLLIVVANDSAAWAAGMLFGKGNQGVIPASPHKSIAGFTGGFVISMLLGLGAAFFIPEVFSSNRLPSPVAGIILGLLSAAAGNLGDLAESALKRSADMKDSGTIIPGRGGVLDTIDSICLAAPVYYFSYWFLFT